MVKISLIYASVSYAIAYWFVLYTLGSWSYIANAEVWRQVALAILYLLLLAFVVGATLGFALNLREYIINRKNRKVWNSKH